MATLIDVATPGPALAVAQSTTNNTSSAVNSTLVFAPAITLSVAGTYYTLNSIALGAGTWAVSGIVVNGYGAACAITVALATASGNHGTSVAPVQISGGQVAPWVGVYGVVVKLSSPATLYLNASPTSVTNSSWMGLIYATQIA